MNSVLVIDHLLKLNKLQFEIHHKCAIASYQGLVIADIIPQYRKTPWQYSVELLPLNLNIPTNVKIHTAYSIDDAVSFLRKYLMDKGLKEKK
jgi:hypothetical protein